MKKIRWGILGAGGIADRRTMPGMQLYTGNMMAGGIPFKGGVESARHSAFCLETQRWPDSPNHANFTDCTLRAGEKFTSRTVYEFSAN